MTQEFTMQETSTKNLTDNSENLEAQEPSNDDNSEQAQDKEPENQEDVKNKETSSKFESLEDALKGYSELEKKLGQQSNELGELRKKASQVEELQKQLEMQELAKAQEKGFNSVAEMEYNQEIVNFTADEYAKHLNECDYPDEMINLLTEFRRTGDLNLLNNIKSEFSTETREQIAGSLALLNGQLQQKKLEAQQQQEMQTMKSYLDVNVPKYRQEFENPAFTQIYGEALNILGTNLDTDKFVALLRSYGDYVLKKAGITQGIASENNSVTDEIAGITNNSRGQVSTGQEKDILSMTPSEMKREIAKFKNR